MSQSFRDSKKRWYRGSYVGWKRKAKLVHSFQDGGASKATRANLGKVWRIKRRKNHTLRALRCTVCIRNARFRYRRCIQLPWLAITVPSPHEKSHCHRKRPIQTNKAVNRNAKTETEEESLQIHRTRRQCWCDRRTEGKRKKRNNIQVA